MKLTLSTRKVYVEATVGFIPAPLVATELILDFPWPRGFYRKNVALRLWFGRMGPTLPWFVQFLTPKKTLLMFGRMFPKWAIKRSEVVAV